MKDYSWKQSLIPVKCYYRLILYKLFCIYIIISSLSSTSFNTVCGMCLTSSQIHTWSLNKKYFFLALPVCCIRLHLSIIIILRIPVVTLPCTLARVPGNLCKNIHNWRIYKGSIIIIAIIVDIFWYCLFIFFIILLTSVCFGYLVVAKSCDNCA